LIRSSFRPLERFSIWWRPKNAGKRFSKRPGPCEKPQTKPKSALTVAPFIVLAVVVAATVSARSQVGPRFQGGVDLINVVATVTDGDGRFIRGLRREDFAIFDDGERQDVTYFSDDRVPVSLGIVLDTSGSMTADKMSAARSAIDRLIYDLLGDDDELFFLEFGNRPNLVQEWTTNRRAISRAMARVTPAGGTAMYDAVASALPLAGIGRHPKKALLVISDGNDTNSRMSIAALQPLIRESEVLVYALGVDGTAAATPSRPRVGIPPRIPFPFPGRGPRIPGRGPERRSPPIIPGRTWSVGTPERVDADALRRITDDTGGRTEIIRGFRGLDGATSRIAEELSRQYALGYESPAHRDGKWHVIRVEITDRELTVRARHGYIAS
jgi:Ca-activated chloride channel family protein